VWEEAKVRRMIPEKWTGNYEGLRRLQSSAARIIPSRFRRHASCVWVAATQPIDLEQWRSQGIGALGFGISEPGVIDKLVATYKKAISNCDRSAHL